MLHERNSMNRRASAKLKRPRHTGASCLSPSCTSLVAYSTRAPYYVPARGHDPRAHQPTLRRIRIVSIIARAAPVIRAHAKAERADPHACATGVSADKNLSIGRYGYTERYRSDACEKKFLHLAPPFYAAEKNVRQRPGGSASSLQLVKWH